MIRWMASTCRLYYKGYCYNTHEHIKQTCQFFWEPNGVNIFKMFSNHQGEYVKCRYLPCTLCSPLYLISTGPEPRSGDSPEHLVRSANRVLPDFLLWSEVTDPRSTDQVNTECRLSLWRVLGTTPSTWQGPRQGGGHNRDLPAPDRGSLPGDESLLPGLYLLHSSSRSKPVSLWPREERERHVADRERGRWD